MKDEAEQSGVTARRSSGTANSEPPRTNLRAQGVRTRTLIVRAATKLLLEGGGVAFTLRAVARKAKISISNLQYYFPDRATLLRAVMAPVIEDYLIELDRALSSTVPPREIFDALIERQIRDVNDPGTMALMWHFASLSTVDPECARLTDEWYEALVRGVARLVERINPDFGPAGSIQFAMLLIAMSDGLGFQVRAGRDKKYARHLNTSFRTMVYFLLEHNPLLAQGKPSTSGGVK